MYQDIVAQLDKLSLVGQGHELLQEKDGVFVYRIFTSQPPHA